MDAQGLVEDSGEVAQRRDGGEADVLVVRGEGGADFGLEGGELGWVAQEVVDGDGKKGGGGLGAGHEEDIGVGVEVIGGDAAGGIDVFGEAGHEVWAGCGAGEAAVDFVAGGLGVGEGLGPDAVGDEGLDEGAEMTERHNDLRVHHVGEVGEDEGDPGVELAGLDAVEGLAEGQVADQVEGEVVEPSPDVDNIASGGVRAELFDEEVRVAEDDGLLGAQGAVGEGGCEDLAMLGVLGLRLKPDEGRGAKHLVVIFAERGLRGH